MTDWFHSLNTPENPLWHILQKEIVEQNVNEDFVTIITKEKTMYIGIQVAFKIIDC